jgi:large subunit ribosomal protein L17
MAAAKKAAAPKKEAAAPKKEAAAPKEPEASTDEPAAEEVAYPGSVKADGDEMPEGYEIKGNASSMLYHVPGSAFYNRTVPEYWFESAEAAEAAGFQLPPSQRDKEEDPS